MSSHSLPTSKRNHLPLIPTYLGAATGFVAFLFAGAVPGVLYGGYMGLAMAWALLGHAHEPTIVMRMITGGGMVLGLLAALFFFLVAGAFLGTVVGLPFVPALKRAAQAEPQVAQEATVHRS